MDTPRGTLRPQTSAPEKRGAGSRLHVRRLSISAVEFWQSFRNASAQPLEITGITVFDGRLEAKGAGWRVAHHELYRRERYFGGYTLGTGGFFATLPGVEEEFGLSEDWPFPGIFFTHPERGTVLMAVLSQERCKPHWSLRPEGRATRLVATERFSGVPTIRVAPGADFSTERWVALFTPGGIDDAVEQYYGFLRKRMEFIGERSILRRAVLWGTWNYNLRPRSFCDITHEMVVQNARELTKLVRGKPHFVMIDDGYQRDRSQVPGMQNWFSSCMEIFHGDGAPMHDPKLFPYGMKGVSDAIRKAGSRPALWATSRLLRNSPLATAHPEWLLRVRDHENGFGVRSAWLDYSLPEVREYTRSAWRTIFQEWGFDGLKLDFWSVPFEVPQACYRNQDRTAVELRNLFLQDVREFVPKNGFVLVAVVVNGGGNPFVGRYVDAARMGMDIGGGSFFDVRNSATGVTLANPFYRHDCLLGDPDSVGWCPANTPGQNRLWATMAMLSGGICEIAGDLTTLSPEARHLLATAARLHKPAIRTRNTIDTGALDGLPAGCLRLELEDGSYEAFLNWRSCPRQIRLDKPVRDIWTGKRLSGWHVIPPYDTVLFKTKS